jgi:hypothetical protein
VQENLLIDHAREEYAEQGCFSVDTFFALVEQGYIPDNLARTFQRELENEQ